MLDYYELLGISRSIDEEKLNERLDEILNELVNSKSKKVLENNFNNIAYSLYYGFKKTLENYGSKTNYDKALLRSKRLFKVIVLNKDTLKKIAVSFVIAGTITGSIIGYNVYKKQNYTNVYSFLWNEYFSNMRSLWH